MIFKPKIIGIDRAAPGTEATVVTIVVDGEVRRITQLHGRPGNVWFAWPGKAVDLRRDEDGVWR